MPFAAWAQGKRETCESVGGIFLQCIAGKQADFGVFSDVCGDFCVAAGLGDAQQRLAELKGGA